jgi:2-oxoglutarate decarboxylase
VTEPSPPVERGVRNDHSGKAKWGQHSDVALLLPHGLEGQGPDHSSGRIERFLQLCAEGSMTVALPSEPANYFHLLRRHALDGISPPAGRVHPGSRCCGTRPWSARSPTSPTGSSARSSTTRASTVTPGRAAGARTLLVCSGKIYWELAATRDKRRIDDTAIVRIEQLYPLPIDELATVLDRYPGARDVRWVPGGTGEPGPVALCRPGASGEAA